MKIFSINDSKNLAKKICKDISRFEGEEVTLSKMTKNTFSDGEFETSLEETVRGDKVFIIGSTNQSDENNLMELLQLIRSVKDASANEINVICPYFGYARQDRRNGRTCITAKLVADLIESAGADHIITIDIHASQIQGFFNFPSDNIDGFRLMLPIIEDKIKSGEIKNPIICSPDAGGFKRAFEFTRRLDLSQVVINKTRPKANVVGRMELIGDVEGKDVIIVDDMIDTAGTMCKAVSYLKEMGATSVRACITHPVLSGNAYNNINESEIDEFITTDSINKDDIFEIDKDITIVSSSEELAFVIINMNQGMSISSIYEN
jgi:ribose-phosphate pyrophosphokinase